MEGGTGEELTDNLKNLKRPRTISVEGGTLWYQRGKGPKLRLLPVGQDRFLVGDFDDFRIRFERDASGNVVRLVGLDSGGSQEPNTRSGGE